jgi:hypothetical protein
MVSEDNIELLREGRRRYIIGTPKSMLKKFEQELLTDDWHSIRDGLEVKFVTMPSCEDAESQSSEDRDPPRGRFILWLRGRFFASSCCIRDSKPQDVKHARPTAKKPPAKRVAFSEPGGT